MPDQPAPGGAGDRQSCPVARECRDDLEATWTETMKMPNKKTSTIILAATVLALLAATFFFVPPPVEGYYNCPVMQLLDGSTPYMCLDDGSAYVINLSSYNPDTCRKLAPYKVAGRKVILSWPPGHGRDQRTMLTVGWLSLKWDDLCDQEEYAEDCTNRRVLNPSLLERLKRARRNIEPVSGADAHTSRGTP